MERAKENDVKWNGANMLSVDFSRPLPAPGSIKKAAKRYLDSGLSVLPALKDRKMPRLQSWKEFQDHRPTKEELERDFRDDDLALCVICGKVSGNLEVIDFDNHGELFETWLKSVPSDIMDRVCIERTPSGGYHVAYQCDGKISGNMKLAQRNRDAKRQTLIETRGEGGLVLCAPGDGYVLLQGDYADLPVLSADEREKLLVAAWQLNEVFEQKVDDDSDFINFGMSFSVRPGDDFNERGDVRQILIAHGWTPCGRGGENEYFRRPGKKAPGQSASLKDNVFYVFSSNASPFEPSRAYSPFAVYTLLEHNGDFAEATQALVNQGYGKRDDSFKQVSLTQLLENLDQKFIAANPEAANKTLYTIGELIETYPQENEPLIDGLLRRGEIMNIIASPKTGKSWIIADLALSMATGGDWMGFPLKRGKVLMIDNELHRNTSAFRFKTIMEAKGLTAADLDDNVLIENQRGHLGNIADFERRLEDLKKLKPDLIVIDAMYRALPSGIDENNNVNITNVYNLLDHYAEVLDCAFVMVHHASKGNQAGKSVTDMGSGAGALSRACDTHMILRPHAEQGCVVMDAVTRSFVKPKARVLRSDFPLWEIDDTLLPDQLDAGATMGGQQAFAPKDGGGKQEFTAQELNDIISLALDRLDPNHPPSTTDFIKSIRRDFKVQQEKAMHMFYAAREAGLIIQKQLPGSAKKYIYRAGLKND